MTNPSPAGSASFVKTMVMVSSPASTVAPSAGSDDSKPVCAAAGAADMPNMTMAMATATTTRRNRDLIDRTGSGREGTRRLYDTLS